MTFNPAEPRDDHGRWTHAQVRAYLKAHPPSHKNIIDVYDQATPGEKVAGASWYPNAHKIAAAMGRSHGVSTRTAAGVIAAYSPQTPWGRNLMEANEVLRTHKAVGGKGAALDIVRTPSDFNESRYGVMASGVNHKRAQALLGGADFENVFGGRRNKNGSLPPHSLKVRSFAELIANGGQTDPHRTKVVIDRHAASVARGLRMTEEEYAIDGPSSSHKKYAAYADAYRKAAEELSKREGRKITPEEVQATTWLTRQRLNNTEAPNGRESLGLRDESESLNYFASYEPNIADVIGHPMTGYAELSNVDLAVVRTAAGVRKYHEPIGTPIVRHSHLKHVLAGHNVRGLALNSGTATTPINVHGDVMLGARLIAEGKHVRLNKVHDVGTLLTDLLRLSKEAKAKHEVLDLCRVSVPKTNLFCAKNKGIDRIKMPQLSGVPAPGSKASSLGKPGEEVDLTKQFEQTLREHGVKVTDTTLPAAAFKATQDQLIGDKVAGIEKFMETAPKTSGIFEPIFVTRDHYIIDGHHRWAAMIGLDAKDGVLGNYPMKVRVVDMDIGEALAAANAFGKDWGIGHAGVEEASPAVSHFANLSRVYTLKDIDLAFNPAEPRDAHGRWIHLGGLHGMDLTRHLRSLPEGSTVRLGDKMRFKKTASGEFQQDGGTIGIRPESLAATLGGSETSRSSVPEGYDAQTEMLAQIDKIAKAKALNSTFAGDMSDHGEGQARSRVSDIAAGNPDLLDEPVVRSALKESGDIGLHRLIAGHDYKKSRTPEQQAEMDANSKAMFDARAKRAAALAAKREQAKLLDDLNTAVSDYEFASAFGNNTESGDAVRAMLKAHPELAKTPKGRALLKGHPELSGIKPTYRQTAKDYDWAEMDKSGGFPEDAASMHAEHDAQITSEFWHDTLPESAPDEEHYARSLWEQYQNPDLYGYINRTLRDNVAIQEPGMDGPSPEDLRRYVGVMFDKAGTTLKQPMTLYRAIRSSDQPGHDWASNFKVGSTFTDKGIMSCTAHGKFAQGWLALDPHGKEVDAEKSNDVVLEIHAPKGQRVVGGSAQFIETMLPPDTTLKIISNERRQATTPRNPLGDFGLDPFYYTHVVAEVVKK